MIQKEQSEDQKEELLTIFNLTEHEIQNVILPKIDMLPKHIDIKKICYYKHKNNQTFAIAIESSTEQQLYKICKSITNDKLVSHKVQISIVTENDILE